MDEQEVANSPRKDWAAEEDSLEGAVAFNLILMIIASFGPTTTIMTACIYFLAKNPELQEELFQVKDSMRWLHNLLQT